MKNALLTSLLFFTFCGLTLAQTKATYSITFTSNWYQATHPHSSGNLPNNAHWSKLVGVTHNQDITFFALGELATPGVESIAETGVNTLFNSEVNTAISANTADQYIDGPNLSTALGQMTIEEITVDENFSYLTLLSMIAPSPDWMIGINSIPLRNEGGWTQEITMDLYPYDSGTDSGNDYNSANADTNPAQPITNIQGNVPFSNEPMGTISIVLREILNTNEFQQNSTKVFPNPVTDKVTISARSNIRSVEIYNTLGNEVLNRKNINSEKIELEIRNLSSGIYLMKISTYNGNSEVKRLIKL